MFLWFTRAMKKTQFANNLSTHIANADEEGLLAEYMGQETIVVGQNLYNLKGTLTVYDRRKLYKQPEYDPDTAVYLTFPDGAEIIVAVDDSVADGAFIHYKYKSKSLWMSIKKYKTMEWVTKGSLT